ncbi:MAG TPA: nuclease-related domain-containing protein, partial [Intrasporangium sp.]|nr:nuclease-related domain-containing protein [Intrasporangium sp.]
MTTWQSRMDGETDEGHQFANDAERLVWDQLSRQVHPDTVLVPNLRLTSTQKDHELDILVLMPDVGIVVVEVKGGSVSVDGQGRWWSGGRNRTSRIRPVEQARDGKYALRAFIEADPR